MSAATLPAPDPGDIVVWREVDGSYADAWDGFYLSAAEALADGSGGLTHMHDAYHRPTESAPWDTFAPVRSAP